MKFVLSIVDRIPNQLEAGVVFDSEDFEPAALLYACGCGHRTTLLVAGPSLDAATRRTACGGRCALAVVGGVVAGRVAEDEDGSSPDFRQQNLASHGFVAGQALGRIFRVQPVTLGCKGFGHGVASRTSTLWPQRMIGRFAASRDRALRRFLAAPSLLSRS